MNCYEKKSLINLGLFYFLLSCPYRDSNPSSFPTYAIESPLTAIDSAQGFLLLTVYTFADNAMRI